MKHTVNNSMGEIKGVDIPPLNPLTPILSPGHPVPVRARSPLHLLQPHHEARCRHVHGEIKGRAVNPPLHSTTTPLSLRIAPSLSAPVVLFTYHNPIMKRSAEELTGNLNPPHTHLLSPHHPPPPPAHLQVTPSLSAPIVLFTYYNPIMKRGVDKFMGEIKAAGAAGIVVPDVPLEETKVLREVATANGLELVLLTTPTTPTERMGAIADVTQGFLYLVSLTGVTGERAAVQGRVEQLLKDIKATTDKPVAVGFGISAPEHAEQRAVQQGQVKQLLKDIKAATDKPVAVGFGISAPEHGGQVVSCRADGVIVVSWGADGVIVGSALVKLLGGSETAEEGLAKVGTLMRSLKAATARNLQTA
ncbi:unnamed protein product [Closterium sp. NIES-65]|nr:unnamed protein product [Closterium sp. NIES-65]